MVAFDLSDYPFWFTRLTARVGDALGIRWFGGALVIALVPYVGALALAGLLGCGELFVRTPAVYLGVGGIAWVLLSSTRAVQILTQGLSELKEVALDPGRFHRYVDAGLRGAAEWRTSVPWLGGALVAAGALVAPVLQRWRTEAAGPVQHGFAAFPTQWHSAGALTAAGAVLFVFAVAVALTFATSVELLVRNLSFAWGLRRFRYRPLPGQVRLAIKPLINAYAWTSVTWSAGIALFCVLFFNHWTFWDGVFVAGLVVMGAATFLVPYASFRRILDVAHEDMAALLCKAVEHRSRERTLELASVPAIAAANRAVAGDPPPVLTRRNAFAFTLAQLVAFGTVLMRDRLGTAVDAWIWPGGDAESQQPMNDRQSSSRPAAGSRRSSPAR